MNPLHDYPFLIVALGACVAAIILVALVVHEHNSYGADS